MHNKMLCMKCCNGESLKDGRVVARFRLLVIERCFADGVKLHWDLVWI